MKTKAKRAMSAGAVLATAVIGFIGLFAHNTVAQVSELRVFCSDGMQSAVREMTPQIERSIGRRLNTQFDSSKNLADKIKAGETFDVTIMATVMIDDLIKQGKISSDSRIELAKGGMGIGVRAGTPKPDISTSEALKRTLLNAKFVTFNSTGATAGPIMKMFEHLGISEQMKPKIASDPTPGGGQRKVAEGNADLIVTLVPEVTLLPGVDFVGPLPEDVQSYIYFTGGVAANSADPEKAKALLQFIAGPAAVSTLKAKGLMPH